MRTLLLHCNASWTVLSLNSVVSRRLVGLLAIFPMVPMSFYYSVSNGRIMPPEVVQCAGVHPPNGHQHR